MGGQSMLEWVSNNREDLIFAAQQHALLSFYAIVLATIIGVLIAIAVYRWGWVSVISINVISIAFTIPSIALLGLMLSIVGAGLLAIFPVLVMYALLPVTRNAIVGLQNVDANMLDAARGMGVGRFRMLWQIELPSAWPVILAGIRVTAQLTVGLVTIAAFVYPIGLGEYAFDALSNLGSVNTDNKAWVSTIIVALIALVFDLVFVLVRRFTTPRGIRV